jgi:hypothetical protein
MGVAAHSESGKGAPASVLPPRVDALPTDPLLDEFPVPLDEHGCAFPAEPNGRRVAKRCRFAGKMTQGRLSSVRSKRPASGSAAPATPDSAGQWATERENAQRAGRRGVAHGRGRDLSADLS